MITTKIDNITQVTDLSPVLKAPRSVKIELTAKCNFACSFCARSQRLRDQNHMDKDFFKRVVTEMRADGVEELGLFYLGESFLVPWLPEAIRYAKDAGYPYVFLTTNGSLATPTRVRECMAAGLDSLKWSFNYADKDQLKEIARVKGTYFQTIKDNIEAAYNIREEGYRCGLYASFIEYDGAQADKMAQAVDDIRPFVDEVYGLPLYNQASLVTVEELKRGWQPTAGNRGRSGALRDPLPCWSVFNEGHITHDGKLSACCFDHNDALTMGDLTQETFLGAWNSPDFQALRAAHSRKDINGTACERCVAWR